MGFRFRIFIIVLISMGAGVLLSFVLTLNNDISLALIIFSLLIVATLASMIFANLSYMSIYNLEALASKIAKGRTKKRYIKALKNEPGEFRKVAKSISEISENLKDKINLIAKQRDQFGSVLDDLGEGVVVTDKDGNITFENDQFSQILNLKTVEGQNIKDLGIKSLGYLYRRSKKRKRADIEFEIEVNDRSVRWVLATINQSKTTKEYILVVHDITQLRSLDSMRRDFISNLSHELRTPVSVIRANSETLLDGALDNSKDARRFTSAILHNSERLTEMVTNLIDLSRIEYGDKQFNLEEIDLKNKINSVVEAMSNLAAEKNIKFKFDYVGDALVKADHGALEQVLNNLLENSIKYSNPDSAVEIKIRKQDNFYKVSIMDTGSGIEEHESMLVFNRFYRTAKARAESKDGSGLGLAIVKHLINQLGGEVGVMPRKNRGSRFWFTVQSA